MAEEKVEPRDVNVRQLLSWTLLFRGFQIAIDPKKLLLAAAGIVAMAFGWWVLAIIFYSLRSTPDLRNGSYTAERWNSFKEDRRQWNILFQAAGTFDSKNLVTDVNDLVLQRNDDELFRRLIEPGSNLAAEFNKQIDDAIANGHVAPGQASAIVVDGREYPIYYKAFGELRTWPWLESRGPNPFLLITGNAGRTKTDGTPGRLPWAQGNFLGWFLTEQTPYLVEPLVKLLRPIYFLLKPNAGALNRIYFFLVMLWTLAVWALFGGAITRMAAVEITRNEKVGVLDAVKFVSDRYLSYFSAPLVPLLIIAVMLLAFSVYGFLHMIPVVGDVLNAVFWPLFIVGGLVMTVLLLGLIGWPMMYATLSTEGSDSFDAISRAYSYVFQCPWQYAWYSLVALAYGMVLVFFVGLVGSLTVYWPKLGLSQTPFIESADREPSYLFIYAPTSFGWRDLLLQGSPIHSAMNPETGVVDQSQITQFKHWYSFGNYIGLFMVSVWLYLTFLMVIGFGYSYFWTAGTIIYLLMRRKVDDTELDEVYLEEEDLDDAPSVVTSTSSSTPVTPSSPGLTMVDAPTLRSSTVAPGTTVVSAGHVEHGSSTPIDGDKKVVTEGESSAESPKSLN